MSSLTEHGGATADVRVRLSIVVCAYNEALRLEESLRSLLAQDAPDETYEIIVVDDGSTDETSAIARRVLFEHDAGPHRRYVRIVHAGLSAARNTGIARARAALIAFIDGDATAAPDWASRIIDTFDRHPAVGVVGGRIRHLNTESRAARFLHAVHYDASDEVDVIGCNMTYRRAVFERVGGFHTCFVSRGDETSVIDRVRADGTFEIRKIDDAFVWHERPESLRRWLGERRANGRFFAWCERLAPDDRRIGRQRVKRIATLSPFVLLPVAVFVPWIALAAVPGVYGIVRRHRGRRLSRIRDERSILTLLGGLAWNVLGDAYSDLGYLRGAREAPGPDGSRAEIVAAPIECEQASEDAFPEAAPQASAAVGP